MFKRRSIRLLLASAAIFIVSAVCGFGAPANSAPAPAPTADLSQPSGGGGSPQPTQASANTSVPAAVPSTATAEQPSQGDVTAPPPAIPEERRLTLEYPPKIRTGDSDVVRLTLEVDTLGNVTPTAESQGNVITGQTVQIPNLYDTHNVIAEARLDLAGVDVRPAEEISEPLLPGQSVTFYWSVHPASPGTYRGTAWLFLRFVDKVTKAESRKAVSAQTVQISASSLLGITGNLARAAGGIGSVVGAVLGFPFADDLLKWILSRLRRQSK
jgi:hypothetical protein